MIWFEQCLKEVRVAARSLARSPGVTSVAVASLAIGIMATTVIYSVLYGVVINPFPYRDVDRLMSVRVSNAATRGDRTAYTVDQFLEIAERSTIFEGVTASTITDILWTGEGEPRRLRGNYGTFDTFDVMGVGPLLGRTPTPEDARPEAAPIVVLGYRFWQTQLAGDPGVLGRPLRLNDTVRIVVGVMPKRFMWRGADVYLPTRFERGHAIEGVRSVHLLGRLKADVTAAQAEADLAPIIADLRQREPTRFPEQWRVGLLSFAETFPSGIQGDIWVLSGAVALLLIIACANVSNLLLSRAVARQREMSVRAALGASRSRLVRQLLVESLVLATVAASIGALLAYAGLPALLSLVPPDTIPDESEIVLNGHVLAFTVLVAVLTSIFCGFAPALHGARRDLAISMREAGRGLASSSKQAWLRQGLVVFEVALALVLLAGASLLVRSFVAMGNVDLGFPADRLLTMRVPLAAARYPDPARRVAFFRDLLDRVGALPGVTAVGLNSGLHPLGNMWLVAEITGAPSSTEPVEVHQIGGDYTAALNIRLESGRFLTASELYTAQPVALVNDRFVKTRLDGRAPLGQIVRLPRLKQAPYSVKDDAFQIVGVVHDVLNEGLAKPVIPEIYVPFAAAAMADIVVVRTPGAAAGIGRAVVSQVYAIDRDQPVHAVKALDVVLGEEAYATPKFNLTLLSIFAGLGLVLALVGVYGVMSNAVAQQRHEIGVRMALGANAGAIGRMVVGRGARLLLVGLALGLVGSIVLARGFARQVWNVPAFDPLAFAVVSGILLAAGLQACLLPAFRAARIDPIVALRQDEH